MSFNGGINMTMMSLCAQAAAQEGATAPPSLEDVVDLHFVALVEVNGRYAAFQA